MAPATKAQVRNSLRLPIESMAEICRRDDIVELAVFGSVLREDFRTDSDIDLLVRFDAAARPTFLDLGRSANEFESLLGRNVDLLERSGFEQCTNPFRRNEISQTAKVIYAR